MSKNIRYGIKIDRWVHDGYLAEVNCGPKEWLEDYDSLNFSTNTEAWDYILNNKRVLGVSPEPVFEVYKYPQYSKP